MAMVQFITAILCETRTHLSTTKRTNWGGVPSRDSSKITKYVVRVKAKHGIDAIRKFISNLQVICSKMHRAKRQHIGYELDALHDEK